MFRVSLLFAICVVFVLSQKEPSDKSASAKKEEVKEDVNTIPGVAGKDYPNFHDIPKTNFACSGKIAGYYADVEARCQLWHYCSQEGLVESFLCPNGTIYSQERRVCEWYYDVDCSKSDKFLDVNKDLYIIPESTKAPSRTSLEEQEQKSYDESKNKRKRYVQL